MILKISKYIGLCYGVKSALDFVYDNKYMNNLYILGDLAHNEKLINSIKNKNIKIIQNLEEIPNIIKNANIVIRTHGVPKDVIENIKNRGFNIIDKTCPKVKFIHKIIVEEILKNKIIILVGQETHPEIIGIVGQISFEFRYKIIIIQSLKNIEDKIKNINLDEKFCVICQTTFDDIYFKKICIFFKKIIKNIKIYNTICNDSLNRRKEIIIEAPKSDLVIIVGSNKSSNSKKLYNLARYFNKNSIHINNLNELENILDKDKNKIFLTSSASTMDEEVFKIINFLKTFNRLLS